MGVARGRCWAAGVVAGVLACVLAVAPSASADPSSVAGGASGSSGAGVSGGVVQSPSSGSPSPSSSPSVSDGLGLAGSPGVPDPSSWLRNVKVSDVGAHTADVSFDWDLSYLLNGKKSGTTTETTKSTDGSTRSYQESWEVGYVGNNFGVDPMDLYDDRGEGFSSSSLVDLTKDVADMCFVISVGRATSVTPTSDGYYSAGYRDFENQCGGGTPDSKMTASDYQRIHGTHTNQSWNGTATWQWFYRYTDLGEVGVKPGVLKGHYDMPLLGLDANTLYGNTKGPDSIFGNNNTNWGDDSFFDAVNGTAGDLYEKGVRKNTKIDVRRLKVGVALYLKDSSKAVQQCKANKSTTDKSACNVVFPMVSHSLRDITPDLGYTPSAVGSITVPDYYYDFVTAAVPDFRTGVEPAVASSTSGLPASAKGGISVDASVVKQGSVARFYVNGLKAAARGKTDARACSGTRTSIAARSV